MPGGGYCKMRPVSLVNGGSKFVLIILVFHFLSLDKLILHLKSGDLPGWL